MERFEEMALKATQRFGEADKPPVLRTCSACAGDYEDPDRTGWAAAKNDPAEGDEWNALEDELLVEE